MVSFWEQRIKGPTNDGVATGTTFPSQAPTRISTDNKGFNLGERRGAFDAATQESPRQQNYVYLAQLNTANGDDDAKFVIAIVADNWEQAETIAAEHDAELLAMHDGDPKYPIVNFPTPT